MKFFSFIFLIVSTAVLCSCKDARLNEYRKIVDRSNRFEIHLLEKNRTIAVPDSQLQTFREILTRDIQPKPKGDLSADVRIDLYRNKHLEGFIMIARGEKNLSSFDSDRLSFGFQLTYGIGMWIDEVESKQ